MAYNFRLAASLLLLSAEAFGATRFGGSFSSVSFGSVQIGKSQSQQLSFSYAFDRLNPNQTPSLSMGAGVQFTLSNTTCMVSAVVLCTATVTYTPTLTGLAKDAVIVKDANGNPIQTTFVSGNGLGPQFSFLAGANMLQVLPFVLGFGGLAVDGNGYVYVYSDGVLNQGKPGSKTATTFAGGGTTTLTPTYSGPANAVSFTGAEATATDAAGNVYVTDSRAHVVRQIDLTNTLFTVAGTGTSGYSGDGGAATSANINDPEGLAIDLAGNLYIADSTANVIRRVDTSGTISTFAGTGIAGYSGDGAAATSATLNKPISLAVDSAGNLYVADSGNFVIRRIAASTGVITTFAGNGIQASPQGSNGDGGPASQAEFYSPQDLGVDGSDNVYEVDRFGSTVRMINRSTGIITTIFNSRTFPAPLGGESFGHFTVDQAGNLFCGEAYSTIRQIYEVPAGPNSSLAFATAVPVGAVSSAQSFTIFNSGTTPLSLYQPFTISGTNPFDFSESDDCGTSLAAQSSCTVSVLFAPKAKGTRSAVFTIGNNSATPLAQVAISGTATNSPVITTIDYPASTSGPYAGTASFSGWAIGGTAASINSVALSIDGNTMGAAIYGDSRPDVCNVYPNQAGCPNVGWRATVDTTKLANGSHTLSATATSSAGIRYTAESTFTVANWPSGINNPIRVNIDRPNSTETTFSGVASFGGWALDDVTSIQSVAVSVDGVLYGTAVYGGTRTDVCSVYAGRPGCPNVGWNFNLDTSGIPDGQHILAVTATSLTGANTVATAPFTISNFVNSNPIHLSIDKPNLGSGTLAGVAALGGWALDDNAAISAVRISVDGVFFGNAAYGGARSDVCAVLPGRAGCPNVGWNYLLNTTLVPDGTHSLQMTAVGADGRKGTVSTGFTVGNSTASNPLRIGIDVPSGQAPVLSGVTTISGWAVSAQAAVSGVTVFVDGNYLANANYGTLRSDICSVVTAGPSCPNVGWNFLLDTTALSNGMHTLTVNAAAVPASGTLQNIVSASFVVSNWTSSSNPFRISVDKPSASSAPIAGVTPIGGWATNDFAAIANITISVDGIPSGTAAYGGTRADVCAVLPGKPGCPNVGWNYLLDTTTLADGTHTLDVTATSLLGQSYTTFGSFSVANLPATGLVIDIDRPGTSDGPFSGLAAFGGWALSNTARIASIQISVDGMSAGLAVYGGVRPDVCALYSQGAGCPSVGWNAVLDTTPYGNGQHLLQVTATDVTGRRATQSAPFNVSN